MASPRKRDLMVGLGLSSGILGIIVSIGFVYAQSPRAEGYKTKIRRSSLALAGVAVFLAIAALAVYFFYDDSNVPENYNAYKAKLYQMMRKGAVPSDQ